MAGTFVERRRSPRVPADSRARLDRPAAMSVRLLDIGLSGVLLASTELLEVGQYARLSTRLGDVSVDADVEIRRVAVAPDEKGAYRLGARFVALDPATRSAMQQFLAAANR